MRALIVFLLILCTSSQVHSQNFAVDSLASAGLTSVPFGAPNWGDFNNDGALDIVLTGLDTAAGSISRLFVNDGAGSFAAMPSVLEPVHNGDVAWGDYDNDNDLDLLVAGADSTGQPLVKIYRNDNGVLVATNIPLKGVTNSRVSWGDYNQDGRLDFLLSGLDAIGQATTRVYRNDGADIFSEINANLAGIHQGQALWGDLNGDNMLDIFLLGSDSSGTPSVKIFLNLGKDAFVESASSVVGLAASAAALGDYNNDGDLDLVVCGRDADSAAVSRIYRNDGSGIFFEISARLTGLKQCSAAWGDADNDGDLDILLTGAESDSTSFSLIYLNEGNGAFSPLPANLTGVSRGGGSWSDFDNDGDLDVMIVGEDTSGAGIAKIYANSTAVPNSAPLTPADLVTTVTKSSLDISWNLTADNETDTLGLTYNLRVGTTAGGHEIWSAMARPNGRRSINARGNLGTANSLSIPLGIVKASAGIYWSVQAIDQNYEGSPFAVEQAFIVPFVEDTLASGSLPGLNASSLNWGDYDNDGDLDLLLSGQDPVNARIARVYRNDGAGRFIDSGAVLSGVAAGAAAWGDFDKDGALDILLTGVDATNQSLARVYRNVGGGSFADQGASLTGVQQSSVDWGDFDNDGDLDILIVGLSAGGSLSKIYRNDDGIFVDIQAGLLGVQAGCASWSDFNNDGFPDVFLAGSSSVGSISKIYQNNQDQTFSELPVNVPGVSSCAASFGDFEGDGDLDILISGLAPAGRITAIYRNDGTGNFADANASLPGISNGATSWLDYDSDGDLDVVFAGFDNSFARIARIYRNDGDSLFTDIQAFLEGVIFGSIAVADYDGDFDEDIILTGSSTASRVLHVYQNQSAAANSAPARPTILDAAFTQNELQFNWSASGDAEEAQASVTYNLRVGTTPGGSDIVAPMAGDSGFRQVRGRGNAGIATSKSVFIQEILSYPGVYWSVQAVDNQSIGSAFSEEGSFGPQVISIADVPNDEGGKVTVKWKASSLDHDVNRLTSYSVWRAIPESAMASIDIGAKTSERAAPVRMKTTAGQTLAWEWLADLPAHRRPFYSYTSATLYDSMTTSMGQHFFFVSAHTNDANIFFDSQPDSGFSVDNLPPGAPVNLTANNASGRLALTWQGKRSADFKTFAIFTGTAPGFDISRIQPRAWTRDTIFVDGNGVLTDGAFAVVAAQDSSGNFSAGSNEVALLVTGLESREQTLPQEFALEQNYPNPFNPTTEIHFALPRDANVKIEVFSVRGRQVTTVVNQPMKSGHHSVTWDGRTFASGTYFYRIRAGDFVAVRKMVLLR